MSKPNSEERLDPISEQTSQQVDKQSQQQIGEAVSASDSKISAEQSANQTKDDLQKSTELTVVQLTDPNPQTFQEPIEQLAKQSSESTLDLKIVATLENSTEEFLHRDSEMRHEPESINSSLTPNVIDDSTQVSCPNPTATKWAPLIYGRTYEVDFRFLVTPPDFDERITNKVWEFIKITTRSAENLSGKPRWIFLRSERRCIIGVTCLVRDLLNSQEEDGSEDLTRDRHGRPLYAFVGFVADTPVPSIIPAMDLDIFSDPYCKLVPRKWHEHYAEQSQKGISQTLRIEYCKEFKPENQVTIDSTRAKIRFDQLNSKSQDAIVFWDIADANNILFSASQCAEPIFLCFGNLTQRDLLDSQFMSAALDEVKSRQEIASLRKAAPAQTQNLSKSQSSKEDRQNSKSSQPSSLPYRQDEHPLGSQYTEYQEDPSRYPSAGKSSNPIEDRIRFLWEQIQITSMDESKLRSYESQLMAALNEDEKESKQLELEQKSLTNQNRDTEADQKNKEIERRKNKISSTQKKLREVRQRIANIRKQSERLEQYNQSRKPRADSYTGFKEKEKSADEQLLKPESDISESKDPWQL